MLTVLQKYHSAAENLSDTVKQSGDFKIWITIDPNPEFNLKQEDKKQVNVAITPQKTVFELCKELESQMKISAHDMTLMEVILNGELQRPLHYSEKVLNTVLRWSNWPEDDRKTNFLELKPKTKFHQQIERAIKTLPSLNPSQELKFADRKTKSMKQFTLELCDTTINVLKTEKSANVKVKDFEVSNCTMYLGAEKKRDHQMRWALTFVELNFSKR
jgi:Arf-GAP with Rho-GAP domain, ANK repeat and PH domain-containing protein 1